jgi:GWxTD domain-containing protein
MSIRLSAICRFIATALFLLGLGLLTFAQAAQKGPIRWDEPTQADYQRWLDQDVRWIISPQERAVFLKLSKNDDRDHFVEDFWSHHDKEEHYRRIAYTNVHFAISFNGRTPWVPGWLTDRGRIYIAYGPPDAIKENPGDANNASAILWHYGSIPLYGKDVDLRFFDVCSCGDYRLEGFPKNR